MEERNDKLIEYNNHLKNYDQKGGEIIAYAGMAGYAIASLVLSLYNRKKEKTKADEIWDSYKDELNNEEE